MAELVQDPWFWQNLWEDVNTVDLGEMIGIAILWGYHVVLVPPADGKPPCLALSIKRWGDLPMLFWFTDIDIVADLQAALQQVNPGEVDIQLASVQARYNP